MCSIPPHFKSRLLHASQIRFHNKCFLRFGKTNYCHILRNSNLVFLKSFHRSYCHRIVHCKDSIRHFFHFKNLMSRHDSFLHHYSAVDDQRLFNRQTILLQGIHISFFAFLCDKQIFRTCQMNNPSTPLLYQMFNCSKSPLIIINNHIRSTQLCTNPIEENHRKIIPDQVRKVTSIFRFLGNRNQKTIHHLRFQRLHIPQFILMRFIRLHYQHMISFRIQHTLNTHNYFRKERIDKFRDNHSDKHGLALFQTQRNRIWLIIPFFCKFQNSFACFRINVPFITQGSGNCRSRNLQFLG